MWQPMTRGERHDYRRAGYGYCAGSAVSGDQGFSAAAADFSDHRFDHQYFPDSHIHSGADSDLCTKDYCGVFRHDAGGRMGIGKYREFYDRVME